MTATGEITAEQRAALDIARGLAAVGVPVFIAAPDATATTGFALPTGWQAIGADPAVVDTWRPGMALAAVMGHGLDLLDVDPRNGGDVEALGAAVPVCYGAAVTPSGGMHSFIRSLGVRSRNSVAPGVDVKAGDARGQGRGFAFIAPTVRPNKLTGAPVAYRWVMPPDLERLRDAAADRSGKALAALVTASRAPSDEPPDAEAFMRVGPWSRIERTLAEGRNTGVHRLAAALRGRGGWRVDDAVAFMYAQVWPLIDQTQGGHEFPAQEFEACIQAVWRQYPDGATERLAEAADTASERVPLAGVGLTDAYLADRVAAQCLAGRYLWARGLGWMAWDGRRWRAVDGAVVVNSVREYVIWLHASAAAGGAEESLLKRLSGLLAKARIGAVTELTRGVAGVHADPDSFDAHPDLLNAGNGVVDLRTGRLRPHDPALRMTKVAGTDYVPGATHPDWVAALEAVPAEVRPWYQLRLGQAATGHMAPDDLLVVQQGGGENGKTTVMTGVRAALGDYYLLVSHRALLASPDAHPTELMDFRGARLALLEETPEERRLSVTRLKALVGTPEITARRIRQDSVTFAASHALVLSTNYLPVVEETDHGTWRRLACLRFPYRWLKPGQTPAGALDRAGDPGLRPRIVLGEQGQHHAALAWLVAGAVSWYANDKVMPPAPPRVEADTRDWRTQTDVVLAYSNECLDFDPEAHVMSSELLDDLNAWLMTRGYRAWSDRLFSARFGGHSEARNHRLEKRQIRTGTPGLSRRPAQPGMPIKNHSPARYWAWLGVRFQVDPGTPEPPKNGQNPDPNARGDHGVDQQGATTESNRPERRENQDQTLFSQDGTCGTANPYNPEIDARVRAGARLSEISSYGDAVPPVPEDQRSSDEVDHYVDHAGLIGSPAAAPVTHPAQIAQRLIAATQVNGKGRYHSASDSLRSAPSVEPTRVVDPQAAKTEARNASIRVVAGGCTPLPALVDRTGEQTAVTLSEAAQLVLAATQRSGMLTVDVETSGYPVGHADHVLRTVQLGDEHAAVVFDATDTEQAQAAAALLAAAPQLCAFSATADLAPLAHAGLIDHEQAWERMHDVVIPAKLADPAGVGSEAGEGLKALAAAVLGADAVAPSAERARVELFSAGKWLPKPRIDTPVARNGWAQAPSDCATMVTYAASDVLDTAALARRLPDPGPALWERERTAQRLTARISHHGAPIDGGHARVLLDEHVTAQDAAAEVVRAHRIDNPASPKQVADVLTAMGAALPRTAPSKTYPRGQLSVAEAALTPLRDAPGELGVLVRALLEYNSHKNAISTFLKPYVALCEHGDGRARPTVYTLEAATGRMSCVRPNFQNIPREGGFRKVITADPSYLLIGADFSGVELRVAAALSQDQRLLDIIVQDDAAKALDSKAKSDIHWKIAQAAYGLEATKSQRYNVKRGVFGRIFGSGVPGIASTLGVTEAEAAMIVEILDDMTPGLSRWSARLRQAVKRGETHFPTYSGRIIHLDPRAPHKAGNFAIQGTARELIVDALIKWSRTKWGTCVLWPVHDELDAMVPEQDALEALETLGDCMRTELLGVPILAEASTPSAFWRDAA